MEQAMKIGRGLVAVLSTISICTGFILLGADGAARGAALVAMGISIAAIMAMRDIADAIRERKPPTNVFAETVMVLGEDIDTEDSDDWDDDEPARLN